MPATNPPRSTTTANRQDARQSDRATVAQAKRPDGSKQKRRSSHKRRNSSARKEKALVHILPNIVRSITEATPPVPIPVVNRNLKLAPSITMATHTNKQHLAGRSTAPSGAAGSGSAAASAGSHGNGTSVQLLLAAERIMRLVDDYYAQTAKKPASHNDITTAAATTTTGTAANANANATTTKSNNGVYTSSNHQQQNNNHHSHGARGHSQSGASPLSAVTAAPAAAVSPSSATTFSTGSTASSASGQTARSGSINTGDCTSNCADLYYSTLQQLQRLQQQWVHAQAPVAVAAAAVPTTTVAAAPVQRPTFGTALQSQSRHPHPPISHLHLLHVPDLLHPKRLQHPTTGVGSAVASRNAPSDSSSRKAQSGEQAVAAPAATAAGSGGATNKDSASVKFRNTHQKHCISYISSTETKTQVWIIRFLSARGNDGYTPPLRCPTARPAACQQVCSCQQRGQPAPQFRGGPQQVYPQTNRGMRPPGTSGPGQGFPPMGPMGPQQMIPMQMHHGAYPAGVPFVPGQPVPGMMPHPAACPMPMGYPYIQQLDMPVTLAGSLPHELDSLVPTAAVPIVSMAASGATNISVPSPRKSAAIKIVNPSTKEEVKAANLH
ncbi:hypothetical protein BASA62_010151 [Batrachochytrium salamandrivorans]|nr:hypothetical protein BASA62_010151 [Batrachochytrium salamandrivorans]